MFNRGREAKNHFLRVGEEVGKINRVRVWGSCFIFSLPISPWAFHRLSISDGAELAKLGSAGS